jgi:hypothetical protein
LNLQVSIQAFNDEDPQGRRTLGNVLLRQNSHLWDVNENIISNRSSNSKSIFLSIWELIFNVIANAGLFLHRRKAEITDVHRKVSRTAFHIFK